jgi:phosphoenolpyruvate carboxykinase (ATP)
LDKVKYKKDSIFGYEIPTICPNVPDEILDPSTLWTNKHEYDEKYHQLAARFVENFKKFEGDTPREVIKAGPKV